MVNQHSTTQERRTMAQNSADEARGNQVPEEKTQQEAATEAPPQRRTSLRLDEKKFAERGPWYMEEREDLKDVTEHAVNETLGVENISVFPPTDSQLANGIIAKASLHLKGVTVTNIVIGESMRAAGTIYMQLPAREVKQNGETRYYADLTLDDKIQAQLLRHVNSMLVSDE